MKLPLHIAKRILQLLTPGETIAGSVMQHLSVTKMLEDGLMQKQQLGKTKSLIFIPHKENVADYLHNHFSITDLEQYILSLESEEQSRATNVIISGNSKLQSVRTFKGFLVNSYDAVDATLNGQSIIIQPSSGSYTFIHDYEQFLPATDVTIVGVENPENFQQIEKQRYLFAHIKPLFVSRYPQSNDFIKWLISIPNNYLHFGDLDFAGISIYKNEFKKQLGDKASFFVPADTEKLLQQFGNKALFSKQYNPLLNYEMQEELAIQQLLQLIFKHKKVLEQEIFISR